LVYDLLTYGLPTLYGVTFITETIELSMRCAFIGTLKFISGLSSLFSELPVSSDHVFLCIDVPTHYVP